VLLMGDDKVDGFRHWRDVAKDGEGRHEIGKPAVEPKKDLAYLVYSSVSLILVLVLVLAMMCAK
jgi:hypothetical protein